MNKQIIAWSAPLVAVAVLALSFIGGGRNSEARQTAPPPGVNDVSQATPPIRVWECFRVDAASDQAGADPKATVRLVTDNFGGKLVRVRKLVAMCELALKFPPPMPGVPDEVYPPKPDETHIYACYQIQKGQDPNDPYSLFTQNFQKDVVQVRTSQQMCEEASKTRVSDNGETVTVGKPTGQVWQCFNLDKAKQINRKFRLVTHNFGRDDVYSRVTFDRRMRCYRESDYRIFPELTKFKNYDHEGQYDVANANVVLELKCELKVPGWMQEMIRRFELRQAQFSKYDSSWTFLESPGELAFLEAFK